MKTLTIMRHSDAVVGLSPDVTVDFDRPLTDHGIHRLESVSSFCKDHALSPDVVLCSPSMRTRQTLDWLIGGLGNPKIVYEDRLYHATLDRVIEVIHALDNNQHHVMIVGHNPSLTDMVRWCAHPRDESVIHTILPLKPATIVSFQIEINTWEELTQGRGLYLHSFV